MPKSTKKMRITVEEFDESSVTACVHLPALPEGMDGEHHISFKNGDRVIFGLFISRYPDGHVGVELFGPDSTEPVAEHEFEETE